MMDIHPLMNRTALAMITNFATMYGLTFGSSMLLVRRAEAKSLGIIEAMTCQYGPKRALEALWLKWAVCWVCCFGVIIGCGYYTWFGAWHYLVVCGGLSAPLLLQPIVWPQGSEEQNVPFLSRHCVKANIWIAVFSFIVHTPVTTTFASLMWFASGNWWYTHYFYSVLKASYSMPAHDVNAVPLAMFFATHFYFSLYHVLASKALRWAHACFEPGYGRFLFLVCLVTSMAYSTAFTESATISAYPCYQFADVHQAYTVGSAFYGLYFVVSYPLFFSLDEPMPPSPPSSSSSSSSSRSSPASSPASSLSPLFAPHTLRACMCEALAAGMLVLMLLDGVRVWLGIELHVPLRRPCKTDASLTCKPFDGETC